MELTFSIIYGSVRSDRQGIFVAKYLEKKLVERDISGPLHLIQLVLLEE